MDNILKQHDKSRYIVPMSAWRIAIPNALTMGNLLFGTLSIIYGFNAEYDFAVYCIFAGAVMDLFDGAAARALGVAGPLGVQLDSLADVVTFGVAPGLLLYNLNSELVTRYYQDGGRLWGSSILPQAALLIPLFSALRLARFNISTDQQTHFIGLPTPANALVLSFFPLYWIFGGNATDIDWLHPTFIAIWCTLSSLMLVANVPLLSLKFSTYGWMGNQFRYGMILSVAVCIAVFGWRGILFSLLLYLFFSKLHFNRYKP